MTARRLTLALLAAAAAASLVVPAGAGAKTVKIGLFQLNAWSGPRIWDEVASLPLQITKFGVHVRLRYGGTTYTGIWSNFAVRNRSTTDVLRYVYRDATDGLPTDSGVFADRALTAAERARFEQVADLYRDADVLVLAAGHPACAGLTVAQAHAIASGRISRWSQVEPGATTGAIHVRYLLDGGGYAEPHFGTKLRGPKGATYARGAIGNGDGGVVAAARGDSSVAAITTWSRARLGTGTACVVPLGGVAATDHSVLDLRYPEAFAVTYVLPRRTPRSPVDRAERIAMRAYLHSARIKGLLRKKGVLITGETPPPTGVPHA